MYYEWFGLDEAPFKITPDTRLFYEGGKRGDILEALQYAITSGEGIVKVVGEVGSGKTMLSRMLEVRMGDTVDLVYLANPSIDPADIPFAIGVELGLPIEPGTDRIHAVHMLQEALLARHAKGRQVVCFVEEAQSMPLATLEEVRLLSNLETHRAKLLQIVLFGQPELDTNLDEPSIRQLRERIVHSFYLDPLGALDVGSYVSFRMRAVGYRGPDVFSRAALKLMSKHSEGLIRRVNILGDKALLAAFADNSHEVSDKHVRTAIRDSAFGRTRPVRRWPARLALVALVLLAVAAGAWLSRNFPGVGGGAPPVAAPEVTPSAAVADTAPDLPAAAPEPIPATDSQVTTSAVPPTAAVPLSTVGAVAAGKPPAGPSGTGAVPDVGTLIPVNATAPRAGISVAAVVPPTAAVSPATPAETLAQTPVQMPTRAPPPDAASSASPTTGPGVAAASSVAASAAPAAAVAATAPAANLPIGAAVASALPVRTAPTVTSDAVAPVPTSVDRSVATTPGAGAGDSLVDARLAATRAWFGAVNRGWFSIQLLMTSPSRRDSLEAFLRRWQADGDVSRVYVYRARVGDADWYGVLLDEFAAVEEAQAAIARLPESLQRHRPYVRTIGDIGGLQ